MNFSLELYFSLSVADLWDLCFGPMVSLLMRMGFEYFARFLGAYLVFVLRTFDFSSFLHAAMIFVPA